MSNDNAEIFDPIFNSLHQFQDAAQIVSSELAMASVALRKRFLGLLDRVRQAQASLQQARNPDDWRRILTPVWSHQDSTLLGPFPPLPQQLPDRETAARALKELEVHARKALLYSAGAGTTALSATAPHDARLAGCEVKELTFLPGAFVYRGHRQKLGGKPLEVLKALAVAPGKSLALSELQKRIWPECDTGEETIRCAVMTARKALRAAMKAAKVNGPDNPLPVVDRGTNRTAWRLDLP
jgi:hypothetical protein